MSHLPLSLSLGLNSGPVKPLNVDLDLGASSLYRHIHSLIAQRQMKKAESHLRHFLESAAGQAVGVDPVEVHFLLSRIRAAENKPEEALGEALLGLEINPDDFHCNAAAGESLSTMGQYGPAVDYFMKASKLRPSNSEVLRMIGECCMAEGKLGAAVKHFLAALQKFKENYAAWQELGGALHAQGKVSDALETMRQVVAHHAENRGEYISRLQADAHGSYLFMMMASELRFDKLMKEFNYWAFKYSAHDYALPPMRPAVDPETGVARKIRVGYVGSDFYAHAALSIYRPLFELADKDRFELYAYSSTKRNDAYTAAIQPCFDRWFNVLNFTDAELLNRIESDQIDILIDLNGHTTGNRMLVFGQKAAPIQLTGLGFITPMSIPQFDGYFTDPHITDEWRARQVDEIALYLPSVMHWSPPDGEFELPTERAEDQPLTFGCANNLYKLGPAVLGTWARILKHFRKSRLLIKARQTECEITTNDLHKAFERLGVSASRIQFIGQTSMEAHVQFMRAVDVALDPFPYQGGVTTCEALFMGVPVIALNEGTRTSVSLLRGMGLKTVADDTNEYVRKAIAVGESILKGTYLSRAQIRESFLKSAACDSIGYVRAIEDKFTQLYTGFQQAQAEDKI